MSIKRGLIVMAGIFFIAALAGCGSSKGSPEYSATTAGKVGILIKDDLHTPPSSAASLPSMDTSSLSQLWVTVNRVSLKMEGEEEGLGGAEGTANFKEEEWLTVFDGTARYDLLALQGDNAALMALVPVPADKAGYYEKARLEIDETPGRNCFYQSPDGMADDPANPCTDSDAYLLDVPSGKIDIEFKPHIYLGQDSTQYIVFDLLPADSIKITSTNGKTSYLLRPEVHAYTMPDMMQDKGWDDINVEELEGRVVEVSGCDDPTLPDILTISPEHGGVNISMDITGASIYLHDSNEPVTCSSLQIGQEVEAKVRLSSDGMMTAESIKIEDSEHEEARHEESIHEEIAQDESGYEGSGHEEVAQDVSWDDTED